MEEMPSQSVLNVNMLMKNETDNNKVHVCKSYQMFLFMGVTKGWLSNEYFFQLFVPIRRRA